MTETKFSLLSTLVLRDLISLCFYLSSQPLYFLYTLLFCPYLFSFFSFFLPLLVSTCLLLLLTLKFQRIAGTTVSAVLELLEINQEENCNLGSVEYQLASLVLVYVDLQQEFNVHYGGYEGNLSSACLSLVASGDEISFQEDRLDESWEMGCENLSQKCEVLDDSSVNDVMDVHHEAEFKKSNQAIVICDFKKELEIDCENLSRNGEFLEDAEISILTEQETKYRESNAEVEYFSNKVDLGEDGQKEMRDLCSSDEFLDDSATPFVGDHRKELTESSGSTTLADCETESSFSVHLSSSSDGSESSAESSLEKKSIHNAMQVVCYNLSAISDHLARDSEENLSWSGSGRPIEHSRNLSMKSETGSSLMDCLQRDGSMRKEKEWKRTLACKLFEERMQFKLCQEREVAEGCEEMDVLWEAYEQNALKLDKKVKQNKSQVNRKVEVEEFEEKPIGEVCCLQALRLSTGKMSLGVGRPKLMKISKALKGMGLLQRFSSRRSSKG